MVFASLTIYSTSYFPKSFFARSIDSSEMSTPTTRLAPGFINSAEPYPSPQAMSRTTLSLTRCKILAYLAQ